MNCRILAMIPIILCVILFFRSNKASSLFEENDNQVRNQQIFHTTSQKPRISLQDIFPNGKNVEEELQKSCTIEQIEVVKIPGRCIKLLGGRNACASKNNVIMDPVAESCNEE